MRRILCEWRGIRLYAYSVALYLGILLGVLSGSYFAALRGLDPIRMYLALLLLVPVALLGARLLFVFSHWRIYRQQPTRIWLQSEGGTSLYGGLFLVLLFSLLLPKIFALPLGAFWDAATFTMLTGLIFGKLGCLLNGCCAGRPTEGRLAMYLPDLRGVWCRRIPAQLLEAGLAAALLGASIAFRNHFPFKGALFLCVVAAYSAGRWALESIRINSMSVLRLQQSISVILLATSVTTLLVLWRHGP